MCDGALADRNISAEKRWEDSGDAARVLGIFVGVLVAGQLSTAWQVPYVDLPYFVLLASLTIYIAAHRSRSNKTRQQISLKQVSSHACALSLQRCFGGSNDAWQPAGLSLLSQVAFSPLAPPGTCRCHWFCKYIRGHSEFTRQGLIYRDSLLRLHHLKAQKRGM